MINPSFDQIHTNNKLQKNIDFNRMEPMLELNFTPAKSDIICSKGKEARNHDGNRLYQQLLDSNIRKYAKATSKSEKTKIISNILKCMSQSNSSFMKQFSGIWYRYDESMARDRVAQNLRDQVGRQYRSSTEAKQRRRKELNAKIDANFEQFIQSNTLVSSHIQTLFAAVNNESSKNGNVKGTKSDNDFGLLFDSANLGLLEAMKQDSSLLEAMNGTQDEQ